MVFEPVMEKGRLPLKSRNRALRASKTYRRDLSEEELNEFATLQDRSSSLRDYIPFMMGGAFLISAFAFAGNYMGQNAIAHNAEPAQMPASLVAPTTDIMAKSSLLPMGESLSITALSSISAPAVVADGKVDFIAPDPITPPIPPKKPAKIASSKLVITPAAANPAQDADAGESPVKRMALAPKPAQIDESFKLKKAEKKAAIAQRRVRLAEENCLARAVYFEARSESAMGQLAVAKVVLNRVKDPNYPNTICGVVYQGSNRRNSCQFSFACDGLPDDVRQPGAWAQSKQIARRAIAGTDNLKVMSAATNYHADYVRPRWAKGMRKLVKIGRHVFYDGS
jgi:spore germination cell wall hydrolase CwlJ-like protein